MFSSPMFKGFLIGVVLTASGALILFRYVLPPNPITELSQVTFNDDLANLEEWDMAEFEEIFEDYSTSPIAYNAAWTLLEAAWACNALSELERNAYEQTIRTNLPPLKSERILRYVDAQIDLCLRYRDALGEDEYNRQMALIMEEMRESGQEW